MSKDLVQKEIIDSLPVKPHGILHLSPRVGKTKITLEIIKRDKPKSILWVTPSVGLRDVEIPGEFKTWKMLSYFKKTTIVCWGSLSKVKGSYDLVILDEIQAITPSNSVGLIKKKIKYGNIVGLTGTLPQHKDKLNLYEQLKLKVLSSMSIDEAVDKNLIADYSITIVECALDSTDKYINSGSASVKFKSTELGQYTYLTKCINGKIAQGGIVPVWLYLSRMRLIYDLKTKTELAKKLISKLSGRTLVFTGSISQAETICEHTYHSKTDRTKLDRFLKGEINTLALVKSGGIGVTYKGVDNLLITQIDSNKNGDSIQKIARSLVLQEGYKANIYILVVKDTVDETWKDSALEDLNPDKITYISYKNYE